MKSLYSKALMSYGKADFFVFFQVKLAAQTEVVTTEELMSHLGKMNEMTDTGNVLQFTLTNGQNLFFLFPQRDSSPK